MVQGQTCRELPYLAGSGFLVSLSKVLEIETRLVILFDRSRDQLPQMFSNSRAFDVEAHGMAPAGPLGEKTLRRATVPHSISGPLGGGAEGGTS